MKDNRGRLILEQSDKDKAAHAFQMLWKNTDVEPGVEMWLKVIVFLLNASGYVIMKKDGDIYKEVKK